MATVSPTTERNKRIKIRVPCGTRCEGRRGRERGRGRGRGRGQNAHQKSGHAPARHTLYRHIGTRLRDRHDPCRVTELSRQPQLRADSAVVVTAMAPGASVERAQQRDQQATPELRRRDERWQPAAAEGKVSLVSGCGTAAPRRPSCAQARAAEFSSRLIRTLPGVEGAEPQAAGFSAARRQGQVVTLSSDARPGARGDGVTLLGRARGRRAEPLSSPCRQGHGRGVSESRRRVRSSGRGWRDQGLQAKRPLTFEVATPWVS